MPTERSSSVDNQLAISWESVETQWKFSGAAKNVLQEYFFSHYVQSLWGEQCYKEVCHCIFRLRRGSVETLQTFYGVYIPSDCRSVNR